MTVGGDVSMSGCASGSAITNSPDTATGPQRSNSLAFEVENESVLVIEGSVTLIGGMEFVFSWSSPLVKHEV